ncbi:MANSC domain-containing protein 4-like [Pristis pectinata]|uniref:MANSC domain-containing protein 4-like n=1 Tax=Pristis pectinata TaxID=685728 RepID=UPI00223E23EF|nr:MANSC domain-containing protein 4-like [Pristis pectinata]
MILTLILLMFFPVLQRSTPRCSPTVFYRNCWLRHFPGVLIDLPLSRSRGAHLVNYYHAKTARQCSRTCCLLQNDTCNIAVFSFAQEQGGSNCFHLNCPNQESCIMRRKIDFTLFNITRGEDPDLLVFGDRRNKAREPSFRFSTNMSRPNNSGYLGLDKQRYYNRYASLSSQATLSTYDWYTNGSLPSRTPLLSPSNPVSVTDSLDIGRGVNNSRTDSTEPPEALALIKGELVPNVASETTFQPSHFLINATDEESSNLKSTPNTHSFGKANSTIGSIGKNQTIEGTTTTTPWQVDLEVLLTPLLMLSLIALISVCGIVWVAIWCKKKRGYYRPLQPGGAGKDNIEIRNRLF